ncbi:MAG: cytidine deaminase [Polyangiales bacterium]
MSTGVDWQALRATAEAALGHAYAPYSGFRVAAALLAPDGRVFVGVNVENASYGLTVCAERNAIASAVGSGVRQVRAMVVVCSGDAPPAPCGACRQVLCEFPPAFELRCYGHTGRELALQSDALLPHAFEATTFRPSSEG